MVKLLGREATIKTAVVEIKALTVSGRQVTQALFKQLPEAALVDWDTLQLRGVPWGRVNYHVGCTEGDDYGEHHHVVWQLGNELRRDCIWQNSWRHMRDNLLGRHQQCSRAAILYRLWEDEPIIEGILASELGNRWLQMWKLEVDGLTFESRGAWHSGYRLIADLWEAKRGKRAKSAEQVYEMVCQEWEKHCVWASWKEHTEQQWRRAADKALEESRTIQSRWAKVYETISELDQLFIAV